MIVASAQFSLEPTTDEDFWERVESLVKKAAAAQARLVLFPEYFTLSWLVHQQKNFADALALALTREKEFLSRFQRLAHDYDLTLVAGTIPKPEKGRMLNRCWIFPPDSPPLHQDKVNMTRFEAEEWGISGGEETLQCFSVDGLLCAVAICYDVEFPRFTAAAAKAGVELLLVPSCTDDAFGYWRVRHCAEARAIENQCFVMTSSVVKGHPDWPEISAHFGQGVVLGPCDHGFPEDGLLASAKPQEETLVFTSLDQKSLLRVRRDGTVLNLRDGHNSGELKILR